MRTIFIDIGLSILLASAIIWFQMQPKDSISLEVQQSNGTSVPISDRYCPILEYQ